MADSVAASAAATGASIEACLARLQSLLDRGLCHLKAQCTVGGEFRPELLDARQLAAYELAECAAELAAAGVINRYGSNARVTGSIGTQLALAYCAGALQGVSQRLLTRAVEIGLRREDLLALMGEPDFSDLLQRGLSAEFLAALGAGILARGDARFPTLLDDDKEMVRANMARFAETVVMPLAEPVHREDRDIPGRIIRAVAELGCFGTGIPERFGGSMPDDRADSLAMIVVTEELSRASLGAAGSLITRPEIAARALLHGGTPDQQQHWLPRLASGEVLAAIAVTEPDYGSDVASLSLKATPDGGGWLLNGSKTWCTFAGRAQLLVTLARSNLEPGLGHRGLSLFLVEKPGFAGREFSHRQQRGGKITGRAIATLGYRGMHSFELFFEDYFVPASHLVGGERGQGRGFYHVMAGFAGGRIQTAARATGVMQAALEQALSYAGQRRVFGAPLGDYQLTRVKLARMAATLTASRQFSYAVASLLDAGGGQMEASLVKLFSCRAAEWITREAMQIHGGMGYAEESPVSRYFVDARVLSIFEGAEETLALKVIARDLVAGAGG